MKKVLPALLLSLLTTIPVHAEEGQPSDLLNATYTVGADQTGSQTRPVVIQQADDADSLPKAEKTYWCPGRHQDQYGCY